MNQFRGWWRSSSTGVNRTPDDNQKKWTNTNAQTYERGDRSCENYRRIRLLVIASKLKVGIIIGTLSWLSSTHEEHVHKSQTGFRSGRGYIDHIFFIKQMLESGHNLRRTTISVFLDLKAASDSVDHATELSSETALSSYRNTGLNIAADSKLPDWECANNVVLLNENLVKVWGFLNSLNDSVPMFKMHFVRSKCKMLFRGWSDRRQTLFWQEGIWTD